MIILAGYTLRLCYIEFRIELFTGFLSRYKVLITLFCVISTEFVIAVKFPIIR